MGLIWKIHIKAISVLTAIVSVSSLLIWLHPTFGYASVDSIIMRADLRSDLIQIIWICFAVVSISSSIILKVCDRFIMRWPIWLLTYIISAMIAILAFPLIDKYY